MVIKTSGKTNSFLITFLWTYAAYVTLYLDGKLFKLIFTGLTIPVIRIRDIINQDIPQNVVFLSLLTPFTYRS
jgi:hypothetical protein